MLLICPPYIIYSIFNVNNLLVFIVFFFFHIERVLFDAKLVFTLIYQIYELHCLRSLWKLIS